MKNKLWYALRHVQEAKYDAENARPPIEKIARELKLAETYLLQFLGTGGPNDTDSQASSEVCGEEPQQPVA